VPLTGDGRSGTQSATPTMYGGYKIPPTPPPPTFPVNRSQIVTQPDAPIPVGLSDTATGTDSLTVTVAVPLADAGSAADSLTVAAPSVPLTDAGTGADSLAVAAVVPLTDAGAATDAFTVTARVSLTDAATAADSLVPAVAVSLTDAATGADVLTVPAVRVPLADSALGTETFSFRAFLPSPVPSWSRLALRTRTAVLVPQTARAVLTDRADVGAVNTTS
jgi:hypothetical protein